MAVMSRMVDRLLESLADRLLQRMIPVLSSDLSVSLSQQVLAEVLEKVEALEQRVDEAKHGRVVGLPPEQLRKVGALTLSQERSEAVEHHVMQQGTSYKNATKADLIETLLDRDRLLLSEGRRLADGVVGSRVLREFLRASLYAAEGKANALAVEKVLEALGAEPADMRQLKLHGSTLGPVEP